MSFIMNLSVIAIIYIGGWQVEAARLNVGDVMAAVQYITQVLMSIMMMSMIFQQIARSKACASVYARFLRLTELSPTAALRKAAKREP